MNIKNKFISSLLLLATSVGANADIIKGIVVEYLDTNTADYQKSITSIGRIELRKNDLFLVYKDTKLGELKLGDVNSINRIVIGDVDDSSLENVEGKISVVAYPNPTSDRLIVKGLDNETILRLFASNGKLVYSGNNSEIDLSGFQSDVYFLQIGTQIIKIVKN
ncbi:MAG: T9SS type A sorting domain-containing protein [Bacteroidales bacterium]|jgi:hypothetical protein|nr:T9SS type A sorting domain-containing protein [Bacteroidales bacterium]